MFAALGPLLRRLVPALIVSTALTTGAAQAQVGAQAPARTLVQSPSPAISSAASPVPVARTERIEAELTALSDWAVPGGTTIVAVRQKIRPGWHTYWRNPGDSGGATTLQWRLPEGVKADDILWPTPTRQRLMTLMNYGYSGEVYLPVPVAIPADARPGQTLPLRVKATFLVCSAEMCVPDDLDLGLDLRVAEGTPPDDARHGAAIRRVVQTAPRPAAIDARLTQTESGLTLTASGGPLVGLDPASAYFYPDKGGRIDHAAVQTGEAGPRGLTLILTPGRTPPTDSLSGVLWTDRGAWEITATITGGGGAEPAGTGGGRTLTSGEAGEAGAGLWALLRIAGLALLGGVILNLMPCVFPILAMKAAALTATAHDPKAARRDGLGFLSGVMIAFLGLAAILLALRAGGEAVGWGFQLQSPAVTAGLTLLMLAVALNLSGVYHVGAGLQGLGASGVGAGPLARLPDGLGAVFTGVLAVAVAAPCTAPFMAAALGAALTMSWPSAMLVFACLGLGLALPYVAVSLSPGLMARLPRPGLWMERLRGLLAFPMYGAGLWLAWVFARQTGDGALIWLFAAALMLALGLWLFGRVQADETGGASRGWGRRIAVGAAVAVLIGAVAAAVTAARTPTSRGTEASDLGAGDLQEGGLQAGVWSPAAVASARAAGRPVLVNFTADWCVSCKINEATALSSGRTAEAIRRTGAVYLKADWTRRDDAITRELDRMGRSGVPLYLVYPAGDGEPRILPQLLTAGLVVEALEAAGRESGARG